MASLPTLFKGCQCRSCAEGKRRSVLTLQVQWLAGGEHDKADTVLAPLPEGEGVLSPVVAQSVASTAS